MPVRKKHFVMHNKLHKKKHSVAAGTLSVYYNSKLDLGPAILSCNVDVIVLGDTIIRSSDILGDEWWDWLTDLVFVIADNELKKENWQPILQNAVTLDL
mgnify:CR=1 FL=1